VYKARRFTLKALASVALATAASASLAQAPLDLKIVAPAAPGGGWDGAARSLQQVMTATGAAKSVQVVNVPGAGGTVGLAQFVNSAKGDGNQLMVMGITMVGAILTNKSPVGLEAVTPIARMTGDPLVIVVPANSPHKSVKDLAAALKADTSKVVWAGGSAGGADHILAGLMAKAAGGDASKLNYVPFSGGGEALAEMLGGRVTAGISGYNELVAAVNKALKSGEWTKVRQQRGWDDAYLDADAYAAFLKADQARVKDVLTTIGLVK
jgi:putative tricarboxylic transport membrane protein